MKDCWNIYLRNLYNYFNAKNKKEILLYKRLDMIGHLTRKFKEFIDCKSINNLKIIGIYK